MPKIKELVAVGTRSQAFQFTFHDLFLMLCDFPLHVVSKTSETSSSGPLCLLWLSWVSFSFTSISLSPFLSPISAPFPWKFPLLSLLWDKRTVEFMLQIWKIKINPQFCFNTMNSGMLLFLQYSCLFSLWLPAFQYFLAPPLHPTLLSLFPFLLFFPLWDHALSSREEGQVEQN